ncbi:hypothetical protein PR003_g17505 [Phytophthora rubi]|uniref:Uncharacterized protein n=1 Tax=Phytophthora rubi TaxID=129364 RepID=A0A6A3K7E2_9STRA|nr:hypothetical protein PR002_g17444 [Phytophthora rubi]KAE9321315.1 hypothetical protein PR003_g17505 [Phytophthora rubi]
MLVGSKGGSTLSEVMGIGPVMQLQFLPAQSQPVPRQPAPGPRQQQEFAPP